MIAVALVQADVFSDNASLSTSSLSRSSSATGEAATASSPLAEEQRQQQRGGEEAGPAGSPRPQSPTTAVAAPMAMSHRRTTSGAAAPALNGSLSGSLQYTVESLRAIVETLPGAPRHHPPLEEMGLPAATQQAWLSGLFQVARHPDELNES